MHTLTLQPRIGRTFIGSALLCAVLLGTFLIPMESQALLRNKWGARDNSRNLFNALNANCINRAAPANVGELTKFIQNCDNTSRRLRKEMSVAGKRATGSEKAAWNQARAIWAQKRGNLQARSVAAKNTNTRTVRQPASGYYGSSYRGGQNQNSGNSQFRN